jgi:iron only hydrogenase large subunit-like protein
MDDEDTKIAEYYHSVRLAEERCIACTHCVRECPTEAIRVRGGKAEINPVRCIDCGVCISICPTQAKYAQTDALEAIKRFKYSVASLEAIKRFKYSVALPSSAAAGQFKTSIPLDKVLSGFLYLGFDEVYEAALGGEIVTLATRNYLKDESHPKPVISSLCPAIVRLILVRFPSLLAHIIAVEAPMDAAARVVKESRSRHLGIPPEEIGVFFITPCSAKATAVKQPEAARNTHVDGAVAISDVFNRIMSNLERIEVVPGIARASGLALGWGAAGGENTLIGKGRRLAVDGIANVVEKPHRRTARDAQRKVRHRGGAAARPHVRRDNGTHRRGGVRP